MSIDAQQRQWLRRCLPVFVQPEHDVRNGYGLAAVFVHFDGDTCAVSHIYEGEASYNRWRPLVQNRVGTWLYRSYNYHMFGRTADVNNLVFYGVDLTPHSSKPYASIWTDDHSGVQTWSVGLKRSVCCYSFDHHYDVEIPFDDWLKDSGGGGDRPVVFLNTHNHLVCAQDTNPGLRKQRWRQYPVYWGGRDAAELYARSCVAVKANAFTHWCLVWCCCCCCWSDGRKEKAVLQGVECDVWGSEY